MKSEQHSEPDGGKSAPRSTTKRRNYVSQTDVPRHTIDEALRVVKAIADNYGKQPTKPIDVAAAMGMAPTTGGFITLTGAAVAYGFTEGGSKADTISLTDLGRRVVAPTEEGDDLEAKREALMRPRVVREFLTKYDGSRLPRSDIGQNVLEGMGVISKATERTLNLIQTSADNLGMLREINGVKYVSLGAQGPVGTEQANNDGTDGPGPAESSIRLVEDQPMEPQDTSSTPTTSDPADRRVFITHGKKGDKIVNQVKEILGFGDFEPVVAVERETTAQPVPLKVMNDMRSCSAAIIHVSGERRVLDQDGEEHVMLNENVLIEIGAAMALYGNKFILLVEEGIRLPSNLQGLYTARYSGTELDQPATMKLLKAFKEFREQGQ